MNIADILRTKGADVATVVPSTGVGEVVRLLAEHNVGALVVVEEESVVGIVSERDIVRRLAEEGADLLSLEVADVMTSEPVTAGPDHSVDDIAAIMTERRIRHVPVVVDDRLVGVVSIGDVVLSRITQLEHDRTQLESYISS